MHAVLWTRYWLDAQGYDDFEKNLYEVNKGVILLEINRKSSSKNHTKNINIRYYFIIDRIEKD